MGYYRGDYYRGDGGNYYKGDPFLGAVVGSVIGRAAGRIGAFVGRRLGRTAGAVARDAAPGLIGGAVGYAAGQRTGMTTLQPIPGLEPLAPMMPMPKTKRGRLVRKLEGVGGFTRRRINPLNPRALRRALRRAEGFEKFAKRTVNALYKTVDGRRVRTYKKKAS